MSLRTVLFVLAGGLVVVLTLDWIRRAWLRRDPGGGGGGVPVVDIGDAFRELKTGLKAPRDERSATGEFDDP